MGPASRKTVTALLVLAATLAPAAPADAAFPGSNGKIAFMSDRDGDAEIYSMNPDGTNVVPLTSNLSNDSHPAWSADGAKIAFDATRDNDFEIYVMNADGTSQADLTNEHALDDTQPAWSPDRARIAFVRQSPSGGTSDIYVMNADGSGQTDLTNTPSTSEQDPAWSPDGTKIAFQNTQTGQGDIFTINPDGTGAVNITNSVGADENPSWSPDGTKIAFDAFRTGFQEIWDMNADGTGQAQLTNDQAVSLDPAWSPDGAKIAFEKLCTQPGCNQEILVMNADGSGETDVTNSSSADRFADWQPVLSGYARPKGATPFQTYLTVAYKPCASANETHALPLVEPSCAPPQQASDHLTVGTSDANGAAANSTGIVRYDVLSGDLGLVINVKDVRNKTALTDYTGELAATALLRITDKANTNGAGTVQDTSLSVTLPCGATPSTAIGSACSIATTENTLVAGLVVGGKRAIWQLDQVQVYDGGADGDADTTGDNTLFMDEGIFVP